jgi:hypothetical protein
MTILNINGKPYTTATEDMRVQELKTKFRSVLAKQLDHAMRTTRNGTLQLNMGPLEELLEQAYYMGREDKR